MTNIIATVGPDEKWVRVTSIDEVPFKDDILLRYDFRFLGTELSEAVICDIESELYIHGYTFPNGLNVTFRRFGETSLIKPL